MRFMQQGLGDVRTKSYETAQLPLLAPPPQSSNSYPLLSFVIVTQWVGLDVCGLMTFSSSQRGIFSCKPHNSTVVRALHSYKTTATLSFVHTQATQKQRLPERTLTIAGTEEGGSESYKLVMTSPRLGRDCGICLKIMTRTLLDERRNSKSPLVNEFRFSKKGP